MKKILLLCTAFSLLGCGDHPPADLILYNARIYTLDSGFSTAQAMAVKDGKVLATGSVDSIRRLFRAPENIDLEEKFIYPGFNDAHAHFHGYAMSLTRVNLMGTRSFEEVLERTKAFAEEHQPGFIQGRGWDQNDWSEKEFPSKDALDSLFPQTPVLLKRVDGHAALANQAALDYAGVDENTRVEGGVIQTKDGKLTGILIDNAVDLITPLEPSEEQQLKAVRQAQDSLVKYGITSVTDAGLDSAQINLLRGMYASEVLKLRINAMVSGEPELIDYFLKEGKTDTGRLKVGSFKIYLDGALGSRGALMLKPYSDDPENYGLVLTERQQILNTAKRLKKAGWQMAVHAIGDSANRLVLSLYEEVLGDTAWDHRWRIEHAQIVHPGDVKRFGELGVIPSVQPTHATSDMYWAIDRLGVARMDRAYPYRDLLESAGYLPLGTDFPVEDIDPRKTFIAAVFRQDTTGYPRGGFRPRQKLSRQNALRGMTTWPAYAAFEEGRKGSLEPGKVADFVVLDADLMEAGLQEVPEIKVLKTYIDGQLVYEN